MPDDLAPALAGYRERDRLTALGHPGNPEDVPRLLAAIEELAVALERHRHWFTEHRSSIKLCGGCLEPSPCKDDPEAIITAALAGEQPEHTPPPSSLQHPAGVVRVSEAEGKDASDE